MCESVIASITSQEIHQRKMTLEEELRTLLQKHGRPFNERSGVGLIQLSLAPFRGDLWETLSPGLKPRAESSSLSGVQTALRNVTVRLIDAGRFVAGARP